MLNITRSESKITKCFTMTDYNPDYALEISLHNVKPISPMRNLGLFYSGALTFC